MGNAILANIFFRHERRITMAMHNFRVAFVCIYTARNKHFPKTTKLLSSVHFNTLSTWSWREMLWALFMYAFLMFPYMKQSKRTLASSSILSGQNGRGINEVLKQLFKNKCHVAYIYILQWIRLVSKYSTKVFQLPPNVAWWLRESHRMLD